jgi:hypothetical protein
LPFEYQPLGPIWQESQNIFQATQTECSARARSGWSRYGRSRRARVQGAHIERDGKDRPKRTPSHAEMLQAERTGLSAEDVKQKITELWQRADSDGGGLFAVELCSGRRLSERAGHALRH